MALIHCNKCDSLISDKTSSCPKCGNIINFTPTKPSPPPLEFTPEIEQPEVTQKSIIETPLNLHSWNWGAFTFNWIWGAFNGIYWPLLLFVILLIPFVGIFIFPLAILISSIILGMTGNRIAWKKGQWRDAIQFQFVQRNWNVGAAIAWGALIFTIIISIYYFVMFIGSFANLINTYQETYTSFY